MKHRSSILAETVKKVAFQIEREATLEQVKKNLKASLSEATEGAFEATTIVMPTDHTISRGGVKMKVDVAPYQPPPPVYVDPRQQTRTSSKKEFAEGLAAIIVKFLYAGNYPVNNATKLRYDLTKAMNGKAFAGHVYQQIGQLTDLMESGDHWQPMFEEIIHAWDPLKRVLVNHAIHLEAK